MLNEGQAGDNVGLLLRGIKRTDVERGQVICQPGSIKPYKKFKGEIYALSKEEGGRHTPFFTNYKPQFFFRTADITGSVILPEGTEMVMPGDNVTATFELLHPVAMEPGLRLQSEREDAQLEQGLLVRFSNDLLNDLHLFTILS
eukprot:jgi/Picre1/27212/NNA_000181.t1